MLLRGIGPRLRGALVTTTALLAMSGLVVSCTSATTSPTPTPDPRIDQLQRQVGEIGGAVERMEQQMTRLEQTPTPTPVPSPTPSPTVMATPTPGPSLAEIQELIDTSVSAAITAIPTSTPGPSLEKVESLIETRVTAAIAAIPTPTPVSLPALVAVIPQVSGAAVTFIAGDITLKIEPGQPLAGRDTHLTLEGLRPWQRVVVEFVDPRGEPAEWVRKDEANYNRVNGVPVTEQTLFADGSGRATWLRIGTRDSEGIWSVRITLDGQSTTATYPVSQLQLPVSGVEVVGAEFRRYLGLASDTYISALVPATLAVDLQAHLGWVVTQLREDLGMQSFRIPDIYLAASRSVLEEVSGAVGVNLGFEAGYFKGGGTRPGIYMRTDMHRTEVQNTLTHEHVHLILDEVVGGAPLPAWLNEGLSTYTEYRLGLRGERPDVSRRHIYMSADTARLAALSGTLLPLTSLESQASWIAQRDEDHIRLQYGEAHMAVRFLADSYGPSAPTIVVGNMALGSSLAAALEEAIGLSYAEFQDRFVAWLQAWEDPARAEVRQYIQTLNEVMDSEDSVLERREADNESEIPLSQRLSTKNALASDAQLLLSRLEAASPPSSLNRLHDDAVAYLGRLVEWLVLERDYASTGIDAKRVQANDMIPEMGARSNLVQRGILDVEFNYQLETGQ